MCVLDHYVCSWSITHSAESVGTAWADLVLAGVISTRLLREMFAAHREQTPEGAGPIRVSLKMTRTWCMGYLMIDELLLNRYIFWTLLISIFFYSIHFQSSCHHSVFSHILFGLNIFSINNNNWLNPLLETGPTASMERRGQIGQLPLLKFVWKLFGANFLCGRDNIFWVTFLFYFFWPQNLNIMSILLVS